MYDGYTASGTRGTQKAQPQHTATELKLFLLRFHGAQMLLLSARDTWQDALLLQLYIAVDGTYNQET